MDSKCVVPPTRPVKILVSPFTAYAEAWSSTNKAAVQLPRDMIPGRSIIRPTLIPERSVVSKCPSSMRMPAQVWHRLSVGGCSPSDCTPGPTRLSDSSFPPTRLLPFFFNLARRRRPMPGEGCKHSADTGNNQHHADCMRKAASSQHFFDGHDHTEPRHPDHIHDPDCKHHKHHRPAAAQTIDALRQAQPEHTGRGRCPIGEEKRKRLLAVCQAGIFTRRKLI